MSRDPAQAPLERTSGPSPLTPLLLTGGVLATLLIVCLVAKWCLAS